jgi:hypothetical protein
MNKNIQTARLVLEKAGAPITEKDFESALQEAYPSVDLWAAKKYCRNENIVDIGVWYEQDTKQTMYMLYPMTEEEKKKRKEDLDWFNNLPG